jgi:hypothetical protein
MAGHKARARSTPLPAAELEAISRVMHESLRQWQMVNGQEASPAWSRAPKWMKDATRAGVLWRMENPGASASDHHDQWADHKRSTGWVYGKTKSGVRKTHPLLVSYEALPMVERRKDALAAAVITALTCRLD